MAYDIELMKFNIFYNLINMVFRNMFSTMKLEYEVWKFHKPLLNINYTKKVEQF